MLILPCTMPIVVHDERGFPVVGGARPHRGFCPVRAHIEAAGLSVIGTVRVAANSPTSLHKLPMNASLLDQTALNNTPATTSDGILRQLPGFDRTRSNSAFTNYGQLRVSFDGAGNDRGMVFVDGVPAQDAFGGQVDWAAYPASEITRAELLRDAGSALYGSGAIGGVLNLQTLGPAMRPQAPASAQASLGIGGFDALDESLFAQSGFGNKLSASLWSSTTKLAYSAFPSTYASPVNYPARSQSDATQLRLRFAPGEGTTLDLSGLYATDAQNEGRPKYTFARTVQQYAARYTHENAYATTTFSAYERDAAVLNVNDAYPTHPGVLQYVQHVPSWENGVSGAWILHGKDNEFQLHAEQRAVHGIAAQDGPTGALQSSGSGSQISEGIALQDTWQVRRFEALAGARYDTISFTNGNKITASATSANLVVMQVPGRSEAAVSPRVALRYDLTPDTALRVSSGDGIRAPYLNELLRGFKIGATTYLPNIALVPERSHTDSAGIDFLKARIHATADIFSTKIVDAIGFVAPNPNNTTVLERGNVDRTQTDGTTCTITQTLGSEVRLRLSETSQYARVVAGPPGTMGKRPQFVPNQSAALGLDVTSPSLHYGLDVDYLGQTYADDLDTEPLGSALLFGMHATWPLRNGASWSIIWQNATDQHYLTSVDRIGLPSQASVRYSFSL